MNNVIKNFFSHPYFICCIIFAFFRIFAFAEGDSLSGVHPTIEIFFPTEQFPQVIHLDRLTPQGDSCAELIVDLRKNPGAWASFRCDVEHVWQFENAGSYHAFERRGNIKVNTIFDKDGRFSQAKIHVNIDADSVLKIAEKINRKGDIPIFSDSAASFDFYIKRTIYCCGPGCKSKVEYRKFTYPPGYMRRDPSPLNYPELSMFHYGSSVRMPTPGSINERAFLINYWHILHPPELEYDNRGVLKKKK
jgi:hypothetical protein